MTRQGDVFAILHNILLKKCNGIESKWEEQKVIHGKLGRAKEGSNLIFYHNLLTKMMLQLQSCTLNQNSFSRLENINKVNMHKNKHFRRTTILDRMASSKASTYMIPIFIFYHQY